MKLSQFLEENRWSITAFAKKIGVGESTLRNILKGRNKNPTLEIIEKIKKGSGGRVGIKDIIVDTAER